MKNFKGLKFDGFKKLTETNGSPDMFLSELLQWEINSISPESMQLLTDAVSKYKYISPAERAEYEEDCAKRIEHDKARIKGIIKWLREKGYTVYPHGTINEQYCNITADISFYRNTSKIGENFPRPQLDPLSTKTYNIKFSQYSERSAQLKQIEDFEQFAAKLPSVKDANNMIEQGPQNTGGFFY